LNGSKGIQLGHEAIWEGTSVAKWYMYVFSYQKSQFLCFLEGLGMENVGIFDGQ
jgi:hypothetical protein